MKDQAERLREKMKHMKDRPPRKSIPPPRKSTRIITVTSGKGGVGKSNFSLNFALSLIKHDQSVAILDVDFGLANLDVLMGLSPAKTILDLLETSASVWDIMEEGPAGVKLIPGGSGFEHVFALDEGKIAAFLDKLDALQGEVDYLILDTGAGLSPAALRYILSADEVIVVTTPEPTSITDAYAVLKMAHGKRRDVRFRIVMNRCTTRQEGQETATRLQMVAKQFLDTEIDHLGNVPDDIHVRKAVKKQIPFLLAYPHCQAAQAFTELTKRYLELPLQPTSGMRQFFKKLIRVWDGKA